MCLNELSVSLLRACPSKRILKLFLLWRWLDGLAIGGWVSHHCKLGDSVSCC